MLAAVAALHVAVSGGVGFAHDFAGLQLEVRHEHAAVFGSIGAPAFGLWSDGASHSGAVGARWFLGDGDRLFASAQYFFNAYQACGGAMCREPDAVLRWVHFNAATVVAGWRFKWRHLFGDAGAGGGFIFDGDARYRPRLFPDLTLAAGWEF